MEAHERIVIVVREGSYKNSSIPRKMLFFTEEVGALSFILNFAATDTQEIERVFKINYKGKSTFMRIELDGFKINLVAEPDEECAKR